MSNHAKARRRSSNRNINDQNMHAVIAAEGRRVFCNSVPPQHYATGTKLFEQGSASLDVYCIESGLIKLVHLTQQGEEQIVGLRSAGWILGAVPVIAHKPNIVTALTLTECYLRRISAERLLHLVKTDPQFSWHLHQLHCQEIYDQITHIVSLRSFSARQRLEQLLLQLITSVEPEGAQRDVRLRLPLKHWEIAQLISVTPQYLSRLLRKMEREGTISREKGWIIVSDSWTLMHPTEF